MSTKTDTTKPWDFKHFVKRLLRKYTPDPNQLSLQLDFFDSEALSPTPVASEVPNSPPRVIPHSPPVSLAPPRPQPVPPKQTEPRPEPLAPGKRRIVLGAHTLDYSLMRSKRRSIGFVVDEDGLRITAPRWVSLQEIELAIREKQRWIITKLEERRERSARRLQPQMQWVDGAKLPYLGQDITLRVAHLPDQAWRYDENLRELTFMLPAHAGEQQLKDRVQAWLQNQARTLFAQRLPIYAQQLGVTYRTMTLSSARTQWGSCTADGRIRLNWRLIHFSLPLIDYVIAHELSHLREMNHSPRFWATVQSVFPEFEAAKRALREHGTESLPEF